VPQVARSQVNAFRAAEARLIRNRWRRVHHGADGLGAWYHGARGLGLIHSVALEQDGQFWEHVSVSRSDDTMPTWVQVRDAFRDVSGDDALGIVVIPPKSEHVDIAEVAHVWRCLTSRPVPDFARGGRSI
jgi:hypothetical protein